ncbi:phosphate ABC transporter ATP-binding protein PstB [Acidiferrimicrobium sp. IK]|nr:phosphate ABC transporter ATP-binding protein PstB [Acidiferrimicrobium sp. IK]
MVRTGNTAPAEDAVTVPDDGSGPLRDVVYDLDDVAVYYGSYRAIRGVTMQMHAQEITALIGPSGCGKTTLLRCLNRMNDLVAGTRVDGTIRYHGQDVQAPTVKPIELRRKVGMVFQKPNPFPKSIFENVAFTPRANGVPKKDLAEVVEGALRQAALWDEVKDKLKQSAFELSGGQQQRLCIARAIAVKPDVILMDEPCSALDPIATLRIEELMVNLKEQFTIIIVTHNLQQAARVSDTTAFFTTEGKEGGVLVEVAPTRKMFDSPADQRTLDYVTGRFG